MSRSSILNDLVLVVSIEVYDAGHRLPTVLDIIKVSPNVACIDNGRIVGLKYFLKVYRWLQSFLHVFLHPNICSLILKTFSQLFTPYKILIVFVIMNPYF